MQDHIVRLVDRCFWSQIESNVSLRNRATVCLDLASELQEQCCLKPKPDRAMLRYMPTPCALWASHHIGKLLGNLGSTTFVDIRTDKIVDIVTCIDSFTAPCCICALR